MAAKQEDNVTQIPEENQAKKPPTLTEFFKLTGGVADYEVGDALKELIDRVKETGKKGELTFKIKVESEGGGEQVSITDEIVAKHPKRPRSRAILFTTPDGWVSDKHPKQLSLGY